MEIMIKISLVLASASFVGLVVLTCFIYKLYKDAYRVITVHFLAIDNIKDEFEVLKKKYQEIIEFGGVDKLRDNLNNIFDENEEEEEMRFNKPIPRLDETVEEFLERTKKQGIIVHVNKLEEVK